MQSKKVAVSEVQEKKFDIGFNFGQIFSYIASRYGNQSKIPQDLMNKINKVVPKSMLISARFSGTMSNYMNLNQKGYGEHEEVWGQWQILTNRLNLFEKIKYLSIALTGNMKGLVNMLSKFVGKSFIYNFVETVHQLGIKNVEFTFNSLSPYKNQCSIEDSMKSLVFIKNNVNLTHLEINNEGYLDRAVIGDNLGEIGAFDKTMDYVFYLDSIMPKIEAIIGKSIPIGVPIAPDTAPKFKGYNKAMIKFADSLKSDGFSVYLVPHLYFSSYSDEVIERELSHYISNYVGKYPLRMTEFNADSEAVYSSRNKNPNQEETLDFVNRVFKISKKLGLDSSYYHSLWTSDGAHFSFIK